jgi:hypothetical protein
MKAPDTWTISITHMYGRKGTRVRCVAVRASGPTVALGKAYRLAGETARRRTIGVHIVRQNS